MRAVQDTFQWQASVRTGMNLWFPWKLRLIDCLSSCQRVKKLCIAWCWKGKLTDRCMQLSGSSRKEWWWLSAVQQQSLQCTCAYTHTRTRTHTHTHARCFFLASEDAEWTERNCSLVPPKVFVVYHRIMILTYTILLMITPVVVL